MSNFIWVRNPTIINGLATTYVSKRGSDTIGDGTAQNPYASIAKATSVATAKTNIMLDDGVFEEGNTNNNKFFNYWGNADTTIQQITNHSFVNFPNVAYGYTHFYYIKFISDSTAASSISFGLYLHNCTMYKWRMTSYPHLQSKNSIIIKSFLNWTGMIHNFDKSILLDCSSQDYTTGRYLEITNCILNSNFYGNSSKANNYTTAQIPANVPNSINNATTGQTFADYFNYYDANDWLKCDFTAKEGSKNIGAGEKGTTIGLNQGYTARADNSANDIFSAANGATVRNCSFSSSLNGYILQQVDRVCAGATSNTITFDSEASSQNGYYVGLFVGITEGVGENQIRYITDYNGATKTATVSQAWDTIPDTESEYTISGKIDSAVKDFGKAIKVKRNFTFVDNMTALANGQWAEFLTAATAQNKMQTVSCFKWEYSVDGLTWRSGTELISATDGNNYVDNFTIGDASAQYNEAEAEFSVFRYVRFHIHIGFNIDNLAEA